MALKQTQKLMGLTAEISKLWFLAVIAIISGHGNAHQSSLGKDASTLSSSERSQ